jgi:hypothetical protein
VGGDSVLSFGKHGLDTCVLITALMPKPHQDCFIIRPCLVGQDLLNTIIDSFSATSAYLTICIKRCNAYS